MGKKGNGALFAILAIAMILAGCSQEGNIVVENTGASEFQGKVEYTNVTIGPGSSYSTSIYIGKTLGFIGPTDIAVLIEGSSLTKKPFQTEATVKSDETFKYQIVDDAGALTFENGYKVQVNELSFRICGSETFDPGLLGAQRVLGAGEKIVCQLDAECWDILVNYSRDELLDTVFAVPVGIGDIIYIKWEPDYVYPPPPTP